MTRTRRTAREKCGCLYELGERERWLELCPKHAEETRALHERAQVEHRESLKRFEERR